MSKFDEAFAEPMIFSNSEIVISAEAYTREQAAKLMSDWDGREIKPEYLEEFRVRYGFPPEEVEHEPGESCWWYPAHGKGSKRVWIYGA